MSNGNTASPVGPMDFGQMADYFVQAKEAIALVPELKSMIESQEKASILDGAKIADLEQRIHDLRNQMDTADALRRSLEVERDQAQFHGLELEEKLGLILDSISHTRSSLADILDGPLTNAAKQATVAKPMPEEAAPEATTEQDTMTIEDRGIPYSDPHNDPVNVPITESHDPEPEAKPFAGKKYHNYPHYIDRSRWIAGGGTDADYDWRPAPQEANRW